MGHAFFQGNGFGEMIYAFKMSDWLGQLICVLLFLISVGACSLVIEKILSLRSALKNSEAFLRDFVAVGNLFEMQKAAKKTVSPAGEVYLSAIRRFKSFDAILPDKTCRPLTEKEVNLLRTTMECEVEDQLLLLEKRTMLLASAVGVCPFLGLFGTVWGITVAFSRLAQTGHPDVRSLAPGVSGALLTTVAALLRSSPPCSAATTSSACSKRLRRTSMSLSRRFRPDSKRSLLVRGNEPFYFVKCKQLLTKENKKE